VADGDGGLREKFEHVLPLADLKAEKALAGMGVIQKGQRRSVQPVSKEHFVEGEADDERLIRATGSPRSHARCGP
jgi:hypothetical protein